MRLTSLTAILFLLIAGPAAASTIDFRDAAFSGANYQASFSAPVDGYTVTLRALPNGAKLYWDSTDGMGVRYSYEADEIEGIERLRIRFSTPVYLTSVLLTDLFNENGYLERGSYRLNATGSWTRFKADPGQTLGSTNGELELLFDPETIITSIAFRAPGWLPLRNQNHEFSVAAMEVSAVPIPAAAWLLGTGLVGLVAVRRRVRNR
jgi:hypothetical protein